MIGSTISHYRIVDKLGEGGMGVVYKAEDTALERPVALKFLANHLLNDAEAKERFLREAKAAAALHHPNVCPVYEIAEADGKTFLAMAFLKGETLEDRIAKGPLPLKDALDIGRQVAEGLAAAHAEGIVHRDIKPANILVSPEGRATVMDFGLARLTEASKLTRADQTVGTAAYMSPEQIQGGEVDHRTDIWALGCGLYEMVAGVRPFKGQYDQALAYEIVNEAIEPLTAVRAGLPMELEFIAGKCLAKDPKERYDSAGELAKDLRTLTDKLRSGHSMVFKTSQASPLATPAPAATSPKALQFALGVCVVALLAALLWGWSRTAGPEAELPVIDVTIPLPDGVTEPWVALSPDGKTLAIAQHWRVQSAGVSRVPLWLRALDRPAPVMLPGTEGGYNPAWSPDGVWLTFARDDQILKIRPAGGQPIVVANLSTPVFTPVWHPDGREILFMTAGEVYGVPSEGGEPSPLFAGNPNQLEFRNCAFPTPLDESSILCSDGAAAANAGLYVREVPSGKGRRIGDGSGPIYDPETERIFYRLASSIGTDTWSRPLSPEGHELLDEPTRMLNGAVLNAISPAFGVYVKVRQAPERQLIWRDRSGQILGSAGPPQPSIWYPELSPDERWIVAGEDSGRTIRDLTVFSADGTTASRLTTSDESEVKPLWSGDGSRVVFSVAGSGEIFWIRSDGVGDPTELFESDQDLLLGDASPDLSVILVQRSAGRGNRDIWILRQKGGEYEAASLVESEFYEAAPKLSPDGRYVVYCSNRSGRSEVYVQEIDRAGARVQVSFDGGEQPRWRSDSKELFYVNRQDTLVAVEVSTEPSFRMGQSTELFSNENLTIAGAGHNPSYDASDDGQRFVLIEPAGEAPPAEIHVVQNWRKAFGLEEQP